MSNTCFALCLLAEYAGLVDTFAVGHSCRICHRQRANERFSGAGHSDHVCMECAKDDYVRVTDESDEDYLYPADHFLQIELSEDLEKAMAVA